MADAKQTLIESLAVGNPVDMEKLTVVQEQLAFLERAGVLRTGSSQTMISPLSKVVPTGAVDRTVTFANASMAVGRATE